VTLRWLIQTGLGDPRRGVEANTGATPGQQNVRKQPQSRSRSTSPKPRIGAHTATSGNYPQARELIAMQKVVGSNPISRSDGNPLETVGFCVVVGGSLDR